ncbi:hypothetical protein CRG98_027971 [Punica granatum]|uniref:Histone deacetylase interacting domain-containing protein n=1 Tax=Punica granatum TaxID=22663 RepID=A0A2I0J605_PUNGR|nr:hypothetical protein CRG98_027971 [Punica granatum]
MEPNESAPEVIEAFSAQFHRDLEEFSKQRSMEMVDNGLFIILMQCRPDGIRPSESLPVQGSVGEALIDSFNMPVFIPTACEEREAGSKIKCLSVDEVEKICLPRNVGTITQHPWNLPCLLQAVTEDIIVPLPISSTQDCLRRSKRAFPSSDSSENQIEYSTRKIQRDDELFRCEDYRYQLNMVMKTPRSAITRTENFLEQGDRSAGPIKGIRDHLIVADLRCIERIYGGDGLEVVDAVHKNPTKVLAVVLRRLEQKEAEWIEYRSETNERWKQFHQSR